MFRISTVKGHTTTSVAAWQSWLNDYIVSHAITGSAVNNKRAACAGYNVAGRDRIGRRGGQKYTGPPAYKAVIADDIAVARSADTRLT